MTDTIVAINGNPGAGQFDEGDWLGYMADVTVTECSHGGSIAAIEIRAYGDDATVTAFTELTPGDVDNIIAVLTRIRATIQPEAEFR